MMEPEPEVPMEIGDMKNELKMSAMFTELVEQSSDVILVTNKDFLITYVNRSVTFLGLTKEEVVGESIFDFIDPRKEAVLRDFLTSRLTNASNPVLMEVCIPCKNRKAIHFDVSFIDLFDDPLVRGLAITLHDVSKRKKIEERLIKANNELDHFMYRTSHDLRAPLLSSLGLIDLVQRDPDSDKYNYLRMIEMNMKKLDAFIEDINSFYRNERLVIGREIVDLKRLINEELNKLSMLYDTTPISINLRVDRISDFYSDKVRVKTVLNNIISNAIKYSDKGKNYQTIDIDVQVMPDHCQITVQDNGIGIKEEYLNKIYQIFYRADENAKGSGLGLYIAKNILDRLGGKIKVSSVHGKGSCFMVSLPNLVNTDIPSQELIAG
ncbi:MAG: HAMP domain-containing sensor histidine kinase [Bacteroidota bacterium]